MFATLLGGLPRPPLDATAAPGERLGAVLDAQVDAGLELITDGGWSSHPTDPVAAWREASMRTALPVKAVLPGPYSTGLAAGSSVEAPRRVIADLADAGCPWIEIAEPAAVSIGSDEASRSRFRDLHDRLVDGFDRVHLSLAITGGSADGAGADTILGPPYASLAVDLIAGPDNWRLVAAAPVERGIVCGALDAAAGSDDGPETLLWAVAYASARRGSDRVGLASASSLAGLTWDLAVAKLRLLGDAARLAGVSASERRAGLDPRAVDIRTAALGHGAGRPTGRDQRDRT